MNKEDFLALSAADQVEFLNAKLRDGSSLRQISEELGLNRGTIQKKVEKAGYVFNKDSRHYESMTSVNELADSSMIIVTEPRTESDTVGSKTKNKGNTEVSKKPEGVPIGIDWDTLQAMVEWFKETQPQKASPILLIDRGRFKGSIRSKVFKVYGGVLADFEEFAKHNTQYNLQDLHSMALIEFMEKYGGRK